MAAAGGVLVVAPHGLDEVLGCGGAMALYAKAGQRVDVLIVMGDGTGRDATRRAAAGAAAKLLGAQPPVYAGFPENRSDTLPLLDLVAAIERRIGEVRPATVYVPHSGNLNIDHRRVFEAAVTALRPQPGSPVRAIYAYEILSSTNWAPRGIGPGFNPQRFLDAGQTLDLKLQALALYGDEMRASPHARSLDAVRALGALRGTTVGCAYAEAFEVVREVV